MTAPPQQNAKGRILIVDDTPGTLQVLASLLAERGYLVHPAEEGALAMRFIESTLPDLILMDVRMPGQDGYEVCARLKQDPRTRDIPVIFLSAADQAIDKVKAFRCGAVDYISKPFDAEEVFARIETQLALRNLRLGLENAVRERTADLLATNARLEREVEERMRTEKALRASEQRFSRAFHASPIPMSVTSLDGRRFLLVNEEYTHATGYSAGELYGRTSAELNLWSDPAVVEALITRLSDGEQIHNAEGCILTKSGERRTVLFSLEKIEVDDRECALFAAFDITARKQAEEMQRRLTRELRAISDCNQVLMRAVDEQTLLNAICRIICDEAGYPMAWVGYAEDDAAKTVRPVAWAGAEDGYLAAAQITWADTPRGRGPTGTAIRCGHSACIQDFAAESQAPPWCEKALERNFRSSVGLPLQDENARAFGALTIYSAETDAFTPAEVRLLGELAGDLAFGITVLRGRIERAQAFQKVTQLAAIVESSDDAIIGKTLDGVVTSWNKGAEKIYGYGENEVLGKPVSMLVPPEHDDDTRQILARIRSGEHIERCETVRRTKDGRRVQMSLTISPVRDTEGRVVGASTIGRDITEHKQAQERLAESEAKYRIVADNTFDFEIWIDPQGRYVYASPSCERLTGYSAEDYIGDPGLARRIVHPDDLELFDCHIRDSHDRRLALEAEWRIVHKDNSIRWISHACQPVFSGNGGYLGARGSNRDITARKHAEQALRESEQRYKLLLNSVTDYIYTVKVEDGRPVSTIHGPGCAAVTGYTSGDYLADPELWLRMICEPDRAAVLEQVATILAGETAQPVEHRILHRDGSLRWVRNTPVSHYDQQRRLIGYDGLVSDITERKRAEEEQAKLWQHLQQAQKMEAIGRLAGGVAHDFNNLLTVINGYCELGMVRLKKGDPLHSDLEEIHSAGMRAAELTQQLLAFSRRQVAQPRVLNLNDQVRDAEKMLERVIGEDIELVCVLDPALGRTKADPVQIHQILMNLVVNARDAMPSGGKLVLGTENAEVDSRYAAGHWTLEPGSYAVLSVTDTGIGMNEEVKSHVFEPFFTTKPAGKGTGMGLATVFGIVQQSRGYITVYSEPDRGTTFRVFLPRASDSEAEEVRPSRSETRRGGDETILVVEDQQAVRSLTCALLRSVGYHVLEAANGGEALLACESHRGPIHLVITDVVMPQMSGPDLLSRLRLLRPEARSLYMSGYPEEIGLRSESLEGVVDYLPKPFGVDRLAGKVREILDR